MITVPQIRAARGLLGWSQKDLAEAAGLSQTGIARIESGDSEATLKTLEKIKGAIESHFIEFVNGGVRQRVDYVEILDGSYAYLNLLDFILNTPDAEQKEILFWGADERRSSEAVTEKTRALRAKKIKMRFLVRPQDTYCMGAPVEYRWLPQTLYVESDVKVIFGNYLAYLLGDKTLKKVVLIHDRQIAEESRRMFDYLWDNGDGPQKSTAPIRY
ncbi:MAG: helix-turn-helix domain-containing protein [Alphaproteobacteria bacterium]|nr:helix-turn-helix domain-containing protein [Alphaproteobacteria bacterium]